MDRTVIEVVATSPQSPSHGLASSACPSDTVSPTQRAVAGHRIGSVAAFKAAEQLDPQRTLLGLQQEGVSEGTSPELGDDPRKLMAKAIVNHMIFDLRGPSPPNKARRQFMIDDLAPLCALVAAITQELEEARKQPSARDHK